MAKQTAHAIIPLFKTGFYYCWRCGIVVMRNRLSYKALQKPCDNSED